MQQLTRIFKYLMRVPDIFFLTRGKKIFDNEFDIRFFKN